MSDTKNLELIARLTGWTLDPTGIPWLLRNGSEIVNPLSFDGDMVSALAAISARLNVEWTITVLAIKPGGVRFIVDYIPTSKPNGASDPGVSESFCVASMEAISELAFREKL